MIITIDGPIATGKSTIAKQLSRTIGFIYFDTGAMYRSFTWGLLHSNVNLDSQDEILEYLACFDFEMKIKHGEKSYYVDGQYITDEIRQRQVTQNVSKVAAIPEVREKLVAMQRELARGVNAVFEGRDTGTVVFPDADLKVFLTAEEDIRARRRYEELKKKYPDEYKEITFNEALENLKSRDAFDMNRKTSPLVQADDAFVIDTSNLSIEEVVHKILEYKDSIPTIYD